MKPSLLSE